METEGQSRQRVGGGRSFWLLCVVVVFCVVAHNLGRIFVREQANRGFARSRCLARYNIVFVGSSILGLFFLVYYGAGNN